MCLSCCYYVVKWSALNAASLHPTPTRTCCSLYNLHIFFRRLCAGCGDFCWLRPAPAGCLPVPPSGHSHCALLQVQVQQRRRRPIANLNTTSEPERRAASRMGHLFFLFQPFYVLFLPPALSASYFLG